MREWNPDDPETYYATEQARTIRLFDTTYCLLPSGGLAASRKRSDGEYDEWLINEDNVTRYKRALAIIDKAPDDSATVIVAPAAAAWMELIGHGPITIIEAPSKEGIVDARMYKGKHYLVHIVPGVSESFTVKL